MRFGLHSPDEAKTLTEIHSPAEFVEDAKENLESSTKKQKLEMESVGFECPGCNDSYLDLVSLRTHRWAVCKARTTSSQGPPST